MAYSELIKDFSRIRDYMRQFYIYGFRTRDEFKEKSARSYDNERRRVESWLGEYMSFRQGPEGKISFISVDTRTIAHNPLYQAYRAKSFTANDIVLHFYILDILECGQKLSATEIADRISDQYLSRFHEQKIIDESTIRKKLNEYSKLGLLTSEKSGRKVLYSIHRSQVDLDSWRDAAAFFSEINPVGVIGSYLLDKYEGEADTFSFKHHYILHALESDVLCSLLDAISQESNVVIQLFSRKKKELAEYRIVPLKIYVSTQNGRSYVMAVDQSGGEYNMYRLDHIKRVNIGSHVENRDDLLGNSRDFEKYLWNTSSRKDWRVEHISVTLKIRKDEEYILHRLEREGRGGSLTRTGEEQYKYEIDVYDISEMRPWIRTFIGRVVKIECSNDEFVKVFYDDLDEMYEMYDCGGGDHAV